MSYDIHLRSDCCTKCGRAGPEPYLPDPTYNLTPIFDFALTGEELPNEDINEFGVVTLKLQTNRPRGLRLLTGKRAGDTQKLLTEALRRMGDLALQDRFHALEPENGWGDLAGAISVVEELKESAEDFPDYVWDIR